MLCAFPHDLEKITPVFENFLKTMWISTVISNRKGTTSEAKARRALIAPSYQHGLQHKHKTRPIPPIVEKTNSTPAKNRTALYASSHIRGLAEHNKAQGANCQLVTNYKHYLKRTRRGCKTTLLTALTAFPRRIQPAGRAGLPELPTPPSRPGRARLLRAPRPRPAGAGPGARRGTAPPAATLTGRERGRVRRAVTGCGCAVREQ